ncbi:2,3-bisphosphoglycerate-independent phosphoglycerate mutase [Salinicola rhizosphaerae]|uniref:2,3-bisphosphoglycerate-independent phosphoglycerate mutase n=1 Tax=Salinicola rhizosphaerae TaxID=1443141 RepID=A0ABQ3DSM6_9GAMM|nr:2,3-bisphosphoglycerate-independent phosphoglycerate mutase [Salinicola rhizosphaerae]GHB14537.1 2,3-bisphosphoglycerate-independent phosphoglycerate mutase [Salinicola rhizosphaerae]
MAETSTPRPVALLILDGYGQNDNADNNAVANADTPVMDRLKKTFPNTLIHTDGPYVGLPEGQMGNSEVGHMNIGAGRIVYQDFTRITKAIDDDELEKIDALTRPIDAAVASGHAVHLMGLLSPGGVHSHEDHLLAVAELAASRGAKRIYLHAFTDGRDTAPKSAGASIERANAKLAELVGAENGFVASLVGRYFAMDRDNRWDRVEKAYRVVRFGEGEHVAESAEAGLQAAYDRGETDEFVAATAVRPTGETIAMTDSDAVLFLNFRADRARELTRAFVNPDFDGFDRGEKLKPAGDGLVMLTQYADDIDAPVAFPPKDLVNTLGEVAESHGLTQLRIAETEKYAHVTFFFSGGREAEFKGEERALIPSPKDVKTYDEKPEMSAFELTDTLVEAIEAGKYDLIICNYANGDMVGHTGDLAAATKAIEAVDVCLGRVVEAIQKAGGECLVTADHGNAEQMVDPKTGNPHTAHTTFMVPLVYVGRDKGAKLKSDGRLCDLAPTLLHMLRQPQPQEMTGNVLIDDA